jgi:hypothetical protein
MSMPPPPEHETPEERFERISKMPGVIVHRRVGPPQPYVPDPSLRVREGLTVREILGRDDDDDEDDTNGVIY